MLIFISVSDDDNDGAHGLSPWLFVICHLVRRHLREGTGPGWTVATDGQIGRILRGPEAASYLLVRPHWHFPALRGYLVPYIPTSLQDGTTRSHAPQGPGRPHRQIQWVFIFRKSNSNILSRPSSTNKYKIYGCCFCVKFTTTSNGENKVCIYRR